MAGSDGIFNIARGRIGHYATLPASDDALVVALLRGVEDDDDLADHDTLADVLASNTECNFTNYGRTTVTSVTATISDAQNMATIDFADQVWVDAGGATNNSIVKVIVGYDPDTTGGTDADIVPLLYYGVSATTDGNDVTWAPNASGLWQSTSP